MILRMKMKRITIKFTVLLIIVILGFIPLLSVTAQTFDSINQELAYVVSELVENNEAVRNCVLSVMKGDGSYSWSGASGIASQSGQVSMTKDIPIYIDSNLERDIKGEELAKTLYDQGYTNLYLCTGYPPETFGKMPWLKAIIGKEPPF